MTALFKKDLWEWLLAWGLGRGGSGDRSVRYNGAFLALIVLILVLSAPPLAAGWLALSYPLLFSVFSVSATMADAFVGEKERGTLETLLLCPLSDEALVLIKWLAALTFAFLQALIMFLLAALALLLTHKPLPPLQACLLAPLVLIVLGGFLAGLEAWIAIGAESMRQALTAVNLPFALIIVVGSVGLPALWSRLTPKTRDALLLLVQTHPLRLAGGIALLLVLVDALVLYLAILRFRRLRLQP
jgi:ABC-type transport system involved in multi-copper enzyme maturation permease subunit